MGEEKKGVESPRNGVFKKYWYNGNVMLEADYKDDRPYSYLKEYNVDGTPRMIDTYEAGVKVSKKTYHKNGKLRGEVYFKDYKRNGLAIFYYENGNTRIEVNYKNDKKDGVEKKYYIDGKILAVATYKDGVKLDGRKYDKTGKEIPETPDRCGVEDCTCELE